MPRAITGSIFPEITLKFYNICYCISYCYETSSNNGLAGNRVPPWPKAGPITKSADIGARQHNVFTARKWTV